MPSELTRAMNEAVLRRLAGERTYQRGLEYASSGRVEIVEDGLPVEALVRGTMDYRVSLSAEEGVIDYSCDCPVGDEGSFCKHCVATGVVWLALQTETGTSKHKAKQKKFTLADVEKVLLAEDKETLVRVLLEWAKADKRLRERVIVYAAKRAGSDAGVSAVHEALRKAIQVRGFVDYYEVRTYAAGVDEAIDSVGQLLQGGQAAAAIELCEFAIPLLARQMESMDDSDGETSELLGRLQDLHYRACEETRPDPEVLAGKLFHFELHSKFDEFFGAGARYAEILGSEGMAVYRRLAEEEWKKVPARTAQSGRGEWVSYFKITHIMESLAELAGNLDMLIGVLSRDLSHAYSYLRIAEACSKAGEREKALQWAERGVKDFPERTDSRLREFLANLYHGQKRHQEAMKLIWDEFLERPGVETYRILQEHAQRAEAAPEWRERAFAEVRRRIQAQSKAKPRAASFWMVPDRGHSLLVELFLHEQNAEAAWHEAQEDGCSEGLWRTLAKEREKEHPEDAVPIYLRQAEASVDTTKNSGYEDALQLLLRAAPLMTRMGKGEEFARQLALLRGKYKAKRNFIKLLDQNTAQLSAAGKAAGAG